jgi:hypothetical protein
MADTWIAVGAAGALLALAVAVGVSKRRCARARRIGTGEAVITGSASSTSRDDLTGAVRSVQTAELFLATDTLEQLWSPEHLERLARTYWRFLSRVTLGLVHVSYGEDERSVVLLARPLKLLSFHAPEYEVEPLRGLVRWSIARGLLVARRGRNGGGYLQIEVRRRADGGPGRACLHIEIEVANFYPAIASGLGRRLYDVTQSRIHVVVTRGFLRSLRRLDLAESRVKRLAP